MISFWRLGMRSLVCDLRSGSLGLLILAVTLAAAALTSVGFFADRIKGGLARDARQLLGGDAVVVCDHTLPPDFALQARSLGLAQTETLSFATMARAPDAKGGASKLVALKAVDSGYPLRGVMRVSPSPQSLDQLTRDVPALGQAWVEASLLGSLSLSVGDKLLLGDHAVRITRILTLEPDRGMGFMNFAPRVMIHRADVAATGLVLPASRVTYRLAVAGSEQSVQAFVDWTQAQILSHAVRGLRVDSLESGRPELAQTLARSEHFLNLVALLAALLSAVAVALTARSFAADHLDDCAMLRVLGLRQQTMAAAYTFEFAMLGLLASALGVGLGFGLHHGLVWLLSGLVDMALPAATWQPVLLGLGVGLSLLLAFGLPPVLQLAQVPPLRVIRRDVGAPRAVSAGVLALGVACFAAVLLAASGDIGLGLITVGGFLGACLLFALVSWAAVWGLRRGMRQATAPRALLLAARQMAARPVYAVIQISSLALGLLALVLLVMLRTDLIDSWRQASPPDAPNRFVINILPEQAQSFVRALHQGGISQFDWYPMIRGRLIAINGRPVSPDDYRDERARRLVDREFNLSYNAQVPHHNQVVAGRWQTDEVDAVSVESGIAKTLDLALGDRLGFDMGGVVTESSITSLRKVDWGSMRANFFVIYPTGQMSNVPATYMSAFKAPQSESQRAPQHQGFDDALVKQFPNVTLIDMTAVVGQVHRVLGQVIDAIGFLFAFTLAAGLAVLVASVTATREERMGDYAVMRALGAPDRLLRQVQRMELIGVGLLAGLMASVVALAVGWALAHFVFEFDWVASWWMPLYGASCGAVLALAAG